MIYDCKHWKLKIMKIENIENIENIRTLKIKSIKSKTEISDILLNYLPKRYRHWLEVAIKK